MTAPDDGRALLRHTLATLAYRGGKVMRGVPEGFDTFSAGPGCRTAGEILGHVGDLLDWAIVYARDGRHVWRTLPAATWPEGIARFFEALRQLDEVLAADAPLGLPAAQLFQGPIADALTHIGQIALLRRLAGAPVRGENYLRADVLAGRIGPEQSAPRFEFD